MGTTPTGLLSAPKDKLRRVLEASPALQAWMGQPSIRSAPDGTFWASGDTVPPTSGQYVANGDTINAEPVYFCGPRQMFLWFDSEGGWTISTTVLGLYIFGRPAYFHGGLLLADYQPGNGAVGVATLASSYIIPKIRYSFVRGNDDDVRLARPFAVIEWNHFGLKKIAGGDQNFLWPDSPALRVIMTDNDPVQPGDPKTGLSDDELLEGDVIFENRLGAVLQDLSDIAASNDFLSTAEINLDMPPTRNPPKDWPSAGSYLWCSFTVAYD